MTAINEKQQSVPDGTQTTRKKDQHHRTGRYKKTNRELASIAREQ